jgi:hypothetical protein
MTISSLVNLAVESVRILVFGVGFARIPLVYRPAGGAGCFIEYEAEAGASGWALNNLGSKQHHLAEDFWRGPLPFFFLGWAIEVGS